MTPDEAFSFAFSRHGRIVRDSIFGYDMRELISSASLDAGGPHFGVLDSPHVNAIATQVADVELIAFFAGAPICLTNAFNAFLSDHKVLPSIGDPLMGSAALGPGEVFDHQAILARGGIPPPKCPARANLARALTSCAQCFLLYHERAHIELGHLALLKSRLGMQSLEEFSFSPMDDAVLSVRRALELDADNGAAFSSLAIWRNDWKPDEASGRRDSDRDPLWILSVYFVFALFDLLARPTPDSRLDTHPSPGARAMAVLLAVESLRWVPDENVPPVDWKGPGNFLSQAATWVSEVSGRRPDWRPLSEGGSAHRLVLELKPSFQMLNSLSAELDAYRRDRCSRRGIPFVDWRRPHTFFDNVPSLPEKGVIRDETDE